jgi:hypothetical protein
MFAPLQVLIIWAIAVCLLPSSSGLRIAEDDAGWIPALYGNGQGHVSVFSSPFPSLSTRP